MYRAYYAFIKNPVYNSKGLNTSAILGFTNTLLEVLEKQSPSHIGVAFDPSEPTFRNEIYPEYKANREQMPEDIRSSIPYIKEIIKGFNIPIIEVSGYEADDVIGTLSYQSKNEEYETYMMTPDKDYGQLLDEKVYIYKPKRFGNEAEVIDKNRICEEFNIEKPEQIIDIMALWGDKSDNIPGAPGIGEKTAKKLISKYGSIENLYKNINDLKGKQKENLINYEQQVKLSKQLVTISLDVPVDIRNIELERQNPDQQYLTELFAELEFRNISRRMFGEEPPAPTKSSPVQQNLFSEQKGHKIESKKKDDAVTIENSDKDYQLIDSEEKREKLIKKLMGIKEFCFDTETTSVNPHDAELVGISFAIEPNEACFLPIPAQKDKALEIISPFKEIFQNKGIKKVGQNIKYDILVLNQYDVEVQGELFDTMIAHYLLQPEQRHNLNALSEKYLNYKPINIESIIGKKGKKQLSMRDISLEKVTPYACEDADLTLMLKGILEKELKENGLESLAYKLEMPLIYVLINMELNGVKINKEALNQYADELRKELSELEKSIHSMAGMEFNIDSPKQLGEVLFDRMKIVEKPRKTKTKQYSTSEETLQAIQDKHPIIREVLTYRSLRKLLSSYVEALPNLIHPKTGKIHTSFNQAIASTGRLSSYNPNLQNIPIREERGRKIRKAFVPSDDEHILLSADYSQIELRIMAHMSGDPSLVEAFKKDMDIHSITAANIFHLDSVEEVTQEQRRKAKTANFGIIYGISAYGLSQRLNIPRKEAAELIEEYFKKFPKVKEYMDNMISFGREHGYVKTLKGRKRFLENINSRNATIRSMAERNAINAPIQGTAADIIKIAMLDVFKEMTEKEYKSKIILQVHDELIFDACKSELEDLRKMVTYKMENAMKLDVPLTVESGMGNNWLEAH
ncbi:MAG: DNA polymerase I [Bacteroidota bacterium]